MDRILSDKTLPVGYRVVAPIYQDVLTKGNQMVMEGHLPHRQNTLAAVILGVLGRHMDGNSSNKALTSREIVIEMACFKGIYRQQFTETDAAGGAHFKSVLKKLVKTYPPGNNNWDKAIVKRKVIGGNANTYMLVKNSIS